MPDERGARELVDGPTKRDLAQEQPILFSDRGCPYAHRVLALLDLLDVAVDLRVAPVGHRPAGLARHSASGRVPLLVHGGLVLTESRVMLEHLADHYGFADAYPAAVSARSLHRHAMALVDAELAPLLTGWRRVDVDDPSLTHAITALERATSTTPTRTGLLALHVAPLWRALRAWQPPDSAVIRAIEARAALAGWLDDAAALECVARTAPDPGTHAKDIETARANGLMPPEPP